MTAKQEPGIEDFEKVKRLMEAEGFRYISEAQPNYLQKCEVTNKNGCNFRNAIWLGDRFGGTTSREIEGETWFWRPA